MPHPAGSADSPLHGGQVPRWLASRMSRLGAVMAEAIVHHYGRDEFIRRLANPFWFQSFGAVMGMDWHSSGITTSVIGSLKRGLAPLEHELGVHICGGRGLVSVRVAMSCCAWGSSPHSPTAMGATRDFRSASRAHPRSASARCMACRTGSHWMDGSNDGDTSMAMCGMGLHLQSSLMPTSRISVCQRARSLSSRRANAWGELSMGTEPSSASLSCVALVASAAPMCLISQALRSAGVAAGARKPYQPLISALAL